MPFTQKSHTPLIDQSMRKVHLFLLLPNKVCADHDIKLTRQTNRPKDMNTQPRPTLSVCITLTWPYYGNQGKCNPLSIKCMRRGHGDTALNLHLQVHQRVIQMNLQEGQGRWGVRRKDQRHRVRLAWKDWHFLFALIWEMVFSLYKNIHIPLSAPFSLPQTFRLIKQKPRSKEWCHHTSLTLQSKENSISLIRY